MRDADRRVGFVHVLSTGTRRPERVYAQVGGVNVYMIDLFSFGQHRDGCCRGVYAPPAIRFPGCVARDARLIQNFKNE